MDPLQLGKERNGGRTIETIIITLIIIMLAA
jgi:hypothetical protein